MFTCTRFHIGLGFKALFWIGSNLTCRLSVSMLHATANSLLFIPLYQVPCELRGCKNRACSISRPEVIKGVPNHGVIFCVSYGRFLRLFVMFCSVLFLRFWLSVWVQSIAWKDSSLKWPIICLHIHSLTPAYAMFSEVLLLVCYCSSYMDSTHYPEFIPFI